MHSSLVHVLQSANLFEHALQVLSASSRYLPASQVKHSFASQVVQPLYLSEHFLQLQLFTSLYSPSGQVNSSHAIQNLSVHNVQYSLNFS